MLTLWTAAELREYKKNQSSRKRSDRLLVPPLYTDLPPVITRQDSFWTIPDEDWIVTQRHHEAVGNQTEKRDANSDVDEVSWTYSKQLHRYTEDEDEERNIHHSVNIQ